MTRLHIGCGPRILSGWTNVDLHPVSAGVTKGDATNLRYDDGTVDAVYSEDLFEHLDQQQQVRFLAECYRVLKSGGLCRIVCPELTYSLGPSRFESGRAGVTDPWKWGHILEPTREYLQHLAEMVGFHVHFTPRIGENPWGMPEDHRPHPPRIDRGNIFVNLMKSKVKAVDVPPAFRQPRLRYPPHNQDYGIEAEFHRWAKSAGIQTTATYLPIYWTNNYHTHAKDRSECRIAAVPAVEEFLAGLDPEQQYYTVSQGAEGIYETLPPNVFVFSSGGIGDEPLPLVSTPHPRPAQAKTLLASFCGEFAPGGPILLDGPARESSSNPDGAGSRVRGKMISVFGMRSDCDIVFWLGGTPQAVLQYEELAARSRFGLAPRGYGKTSFRLYEMLALGTVPVYIYDDPWLPYRDQLDWSTFCVLCHESDIAALPARLLAIPDEWYNEARRIADELFEEYFTMPGTCRQIARIVQERWPLT